MHELCIEVTSLLFTNTPHSYVSTWLARYDNHKDTGYI